MYLPTTQAVKKELAMAVISAENIIFVERFTRFLQMTAMTPVTVPTVPMFAKSFTANMASITDLSWKQ